MELRDEIAAIIWDYDNTNLKSAAETVDAILAIPEIREAMRYRNIVLASRMPDLPPDRVGELIRDLANRVAD